MNFINLAILYISSAVAFFALDMLWLGVIARDLYRNSLSPLLAKQFNRIAAFSFYALFLAGVLIFATVPALNDGDLKQAILYGGLFGFFTYATYDLTNLSTLKNWPAKLSVIDIIWGVVLTSSVAAAGYQVGLWLGL